MRANIRESTPADFHRIEDLYRVTFPEEDLVPLVKDLLAQEQGVLSLIAIQEDAVIGHVGFTVCSAGAGPETLALLAPLAVAPAFQRRGIGNSLVQAGFEALRTHAAHTVLVLGDPAYYSRFGFAPERQVIPPYALPPEWLDAWQSVQLLEPNLRPEGTLKVTDFWMKASLWG